MASICCWRDIILQSEQRVSARFLLTTRLLGDQAWICPQVGEEFLMRPASNGCSHHFRLPGAACVCEGVSPPPPPRPIGTFNPSLLLNGFGIIASSNKENCSSGSIFPGGRSVGRSVMCDLPRSTSAHECSAQLGKDPALVLCRRVSPAELHKGKQSTLEP